MPVLLIDVCNSPDFTDFQKKFFWEHVLANFSGNPYAPPRYIAASCLSELWSRYDNGGISVGRSLRAVILELAIVLLDRKYIKEAEKLIAILVALYHSPSYINSHDWFDYHVEAGSLPMGERVILCTAMIALGGRYVPDILECTDEYIWEQINDGKEKVRLLLKAD